MTRNHTSGFTLIELIAVIILLSIISISASSYFSGISSVSAHTLQTELLRSLRLTQTRAMNRNGYCNRWLINSNRAQQVSLDKEEQCSTSFPNAQGNTEYLENEDITYVAILEKQNAYFALQIGNQYNALATPFAFDFDVMGRVMQCKNTTCEIFINAKSQTKICIEKEGYIHAC
ncbi:prepilin-type N-terminal cleavage/methylation domain-containing protein [Aliivibrio sp. S4TY2]|uniref:prepilin-type N-terminal cleavage/methylation domain-containing protein n=1 Tax=unclassified Aliivibrio TaxID=2645654 RepID=UPI002379C894|nr:MULTISPECIES: prepilin-type N-terminal cleavage/methylation domain-containing protein [unclassified Aliivibrio]MDD9155278.1 prepilin-type N-terminal cleavage/methylation domain-containing protein [Aliivibrio sp. S4TY2]MDD9159170.1 prepilin-type N-terminal cleavage/methylation domain-containing protein [Aliivibrio sp. S4TY1]MDD9163280.1 prepilin-type N-terminal cleavage/methylation domain-containing protein [Aliivibrio sp. S4MY2]MDD9167169.1 prepilin-type N-terminal cleavage/methylation domai